MSIQIEAEKFLYSIPEKYPHLRGQINQWLIDSVVHEMKAVGIYREDVTAGSFQVGLLAAMANGRVPQPPPQVVERVVEKPEPKPKALSSKQIRESLDVGIGTTGGRKNHAQVEPRVISEGEGQVLIDAMEKSAQRFVQRTLEHPHGTTHTQREEIRSAVQTIIEEESSDPIGRWKRSAHRVEEAVKRIEVERQRF